MAKTVDLASPEAHLRGVYRRRPTPEDENPVLTFRVPRDVADELGRFVATWQAVFMAAREHEEQHPESAAWFMIASHYGNPDSSGARMAPLSESSFLLGAVLHAMKEYRVHILTESERNPLSHSEEQIAADPLRRIARPLTEWARAHPHVDLWGLAQKAYTRTMVRAETRRRTKSGERPTTLHAAKRTARAQARRAIPQPTSETEA